MSHSTTLHGLGELVAYLPYALGFRPHESLVVVTHQARGVGVVARCDLSTDRDEVDRTVAALTPRLARNCPLGFDLVAFTDHETHGGGRQTVMTGHALSRVATVRHVLQVDNAATSWSALNCSCGRGCELGARRPVPGDHQVAAVMDRVAQGVRPLSERADLEHLLAPDPRLSIAVAAVLRRDHPPGHARRECRPALRRVLTGPDVSGAERPPVLAAALCALVDTADRDAAMAWMAPDVLGLLDGDVVPARAAPAPEETVVAGALTERLRLLVTAAPPRAAAEAASLLAFWHWRRGDGAAASVAVRRGLVADPEHRLCALIGAVLDSGIGPRRYGRADPLAEPRVGG